jgi:hypothetical protein
MSCNEEVLCIIVFRAQLEMEFHNRPQRNAGIGRAKLDRNHLGEQDIAGLIKKLL